MNFFYSFLQVFFFAIQSNEIQYSILLLKSEIREQGKR